MPSICFYFEVHQPCRLRPFNFFDIGMNKDYIDSGQDKGIMRKVSEKCYLPMNSLLYDLIRKYNGRFRCSFSLTGTVIDQFIEYAPEVLESFQRLANTGCVEFLDETDSHSLAFLFSEDEFRNQVSRHRERIKSLFGQEPRAFRNTELIYNNDLARLIESMGYSSILTEGADHVLHWRSPHYIYRPVGCNYIQLLLKSYSLSDDIAFRFSNRSWNQYPLFAEKFSAWVHRIKGAGDVINLFMDYETFGEHQWADTGIFDFMRALPGCIFTDPDFNFLTVSEAARAYHACGQLDTPAIISWADEERDLSAWLGNDMQKDALSTLYSLAEKVRLVHDPEIQQTWRRLQTSDHFYYMSPKCASDGDVHKYFSPYGSPFEAYTNFMNIVADFRLKLNGLTT